MLSEFGVNLTVTLDDISSEGSDACQGDSGGPLYKWVGRGSESKSGEKEDREGQRAVLIGIVSRGQGCAQKNKAGVYVRSAFRTFYSYIFG